MFTLNVSLDSVLHRNGKEWRSDRLLLNKEVMMSAAVQRFLPLLDEVSRDFCSALRAKVEGQGRGSLTMDPSPDLFRFALEGQRSSVRGVNGRLLQAEAKHCPYLGEQKKRGEETVESEALMSSCFFCL